MDNEGKAVDALDYLAIQKQPKTLKDITAVGGLMFFYPGTPVARKSGIHQTHRDQKATDYAEGLGWAAWSAARANGVEWNRRYLPMREGVVLGIAVYRLGHNCRKPDLDNYMKLVSDAMTAAHIFTDDAQVVEFFPGSRKEESPTEGIRIILVPLAAMERLGFRRIYEI